MQADADWLTRLASVTQCRGYERFTHLRLADSQVLVREGSEKAPDVANCLGDELDLLVAAGCNPQLLARLVGRRGRLGG